MKKIITSAIVIILVGASCAPTTKLFNSEKTAGIDFKNYKTYAFLPTDDTSYAKMINRKVFVESLSGAGMNELSKRGMTMDSVHPDCFFKYSLVMSRKYETSQQSTMAYNNYSDIYDPGHHYDNQVYFFSSDNRPAVYKGKMDIATLREGTLVIDMIDSKSMNVLWRTSYTNKRNEAEMQDLKNIVGYIVPEMFKKFPVK